MRRKEVEGKQAALWIEEYTVASKVRAKWNTLRTEFVCIQNTFLVIKDAN